MFASEFQEGFGTWMLGYAPFGGGEVGEIAAVAAEVGDGGDDAFHQAFVGLGDRLVAEADTAAGAGHRASASEGYLRASVAYATANRPLFGTPVDPRLLVTHRRARAAFEAGLALRSTPALAFDIPFEDAVMRSYLLPAEGCENERRPLIVLVNGYDATAADLYFASGVAAGRRGYHCLIFEGPGQGSTLYEQGIPLRPDFERVVSAVIDHVADQAIVDEDRIVVSGWSLGGHLAPRAASGDPRVVACIADPGQADLGAGLGGFLRLLGATEDEARDPLNLDDAAAARLMAVIEGDRRLRWSVVQRGFWANGVTDLRSFLRRTAEFTLRDRLDRIRCPVLLTRAENDPLAAGVGAFAVALDAAGVHTTVIDFAAAEGAGMHCEMMNRSLLNRRVLDWLDDVLAP
ncbi:alpha/beta hydrolase family protein [Microbacterium panaciterrae]|uniref:Alpha/beta hydrolase n=1 Tax=Microbacterium panaciterrae TaxID=985759 RepID=A0ABP8P1H5_9MICO